MEWLATVQHPSTGFSSLPFAIGTVQDAGLIFISSMSNTIASRIMDEGGTIDDVLSTPTLVLPAHFLLLQHPSTGYSSLPFAIVGTVQDAGLIFSQTWCPARSIIKVESDPVLSLLMVIILSIFYIVIFPPGTGLDGAHEGGWVRMLLHQQV